MELFEILFVVVTIGVPIFFIFELISDSKKGRKISILATIGKIMATLVMCYFGLIVFFIAYFVISCASKF